MVVLALACPYSWPSQQMNNVTYRIFFERATKHPAYPYQERLAIGEWPTLIDVPTGLGKTAAVGVAWLYRHLRQEPVARRLIWCLPMRALVEQTHRAVSEWCERVAPLFKERSIEAPRAQMIMGGMQETDWEGRPEDPFAIIGTQDMLLSRALMRGYGMSRYRWPIHFALLNNDALWVLDETQLMGVGIETSAQLQGFRERLGCEGTVRTIWMSATLGREQIRTVDHPEPAGGWSVETLEEAELRLPEVRERSEAAKAVSRSPVVVPEDRKSRDVYPERLAERVLELHRPDSLTLVILNRVNRAQAVYRHLLETGRTVERTALLHSRFRSSDRRRHATLLDEKGDRIIVSTQVVEAGVDASASTMVTELAPWPSLVQRFGRCNRYGEAPDARIEWVDLEQVDEKDDLALPYAAEDLGRARSILTEITDAAPAFVGAIPYSEPPVVRPVVRRKDLLELYDTTSDLSGADLDVSRYVRDDRDTDVGLFWRDVGSEGPGEETPRPHDEEVCRVSIGQANRFLGKKKVRAWWFDPLTDQWRPARRLRPNQNVLVAADCGGYDPLLGWTGELARAGGDVSIAIQEGEQPESYGDDPGTDIGVWVGLADHLESVEREARSLARELGVGPDWSERLCSAAVWHDVGKAHPVFQDMLLAPVGREGSTIEGPGGPGPWAKSNHREGRAARKYFRHELASALAFLQQSDGPDVDAVAYLIAAHHGKVRLSIRSFPGEAEPDREDAHGLFARGVWHGDQLPAVDLGNGGRSDPCELDLTPMRLGEGSWLERMLALRDDPDIGPFRLAFWESLLRVADWRGSAAPSTEGAA